MFDGFHASVIVLGCRPFSAPPFWGAKYLELFFFLKKKDYLCRQVNTVRYNLKFNSAHSRTAVFGCAFLLKNSNKFSHNPRSSGSLSPPRLSIRLFRYQSSFFALVQSIHRRLSRHLEWLIAWLISSLASI